MFRKAQRAAFLPHCVGFLRKKTHRAQNALRQAKRLQPVLIVLRRLFRDILLHLLSVGRTRAEGEQRSTLPNPPLQREGGEEQKRSFLRIVGVFLSQFFKGLFLG